MPYLLPTEKFQQQSEKEGLALELTVWGFSGILVHALAQGIRRKPVFAKPYIHGISALIFMGVGYGAHLLEVNALKRLERERDLLVMKRLERKQANE